MDNNFWEHRAEDKEMQEELEALRIPRTEKREGSYLTYGSWYSAMIIDGLGHRIDTCVHRHRYRYTAQICADMMEAKMKGAQR